MDRESKFYEIGKFLMKSMKNQQKYLQKYLQKNTPNKSVKTLKEAWKNPYEIKKQMHVCLNIS